jgi:AraC family transcriptional regulator, regulatory protein of adaptative response / methylated-DNA-[protein]-cysteine methyltransferase
MRPRSRISPIVSGSDRATCCGYFFTMTGATPTEIAATRRVQAAKRLIDQTAMPLSEIAFAAGFRSIRRFNAAFRAIYGRAPSSFRQTPT